MMKLMEALVMRRAWLRLAMQRFQVGGMNVSGHSRIWSNIKNSVQFRITLQKMRIVNLISTQSDDYLI